MIPTTAVTTRLVTLTFLVATTSPTFAETPSPETAQDVLERARAALGQVTAVEYDAEVFLNAVVDPADASTRPAPFAAGRVQAQDNPGFEELRLNIEGSLRRMARFHVITDGARVLTLSKEHRTATRVDFRSTGRSMSVPLLLFDRNFFHPRPLELALNAQSRLLEEARVVDGVECHVVKVTHRASADIMRWHFAKQDLLPRRIEWLGTTDVPKKTLLLKGLRTRERFREEVFSVEPPEGFRVREQNSIVLRGANTPLPVGSTAPAWSLTDEHGKKVSLASLRGKVVLIDFWSTTCGPCKRSMPALQQLHEHFAQEDVRVVGINCFERGDASSYVKSHGYTYTHLLSGSAVARAYNVHAIPAFYVIDPDGKIAYAGGGFSDDLLPRLARIIRGARRKAPNERDE